MGIIMANTMIDIHTHILYDIDDGCTSMEQSIETIKKLELLGFSKIILTPHFIEGSKYCSDNKEKQEKYKLLIKRLKKQNVNVELYLGNEIYINHQMIELIKQKKILSLNNTKYLLIELPLNNEINNVDDYLHELRLAGYIPVIAHPERYKYFHSDYKKMQKLYEDGVLFQSNYGSILGYYGKDAKKLIKYALKHSWISFLATDIHGPNFKLVGQFYKAVKKIKRIIGEDNFQKITQKNASKLLCDDIVE